MKKSLLCKGMFIGACVGGLLTLLDRNTRTETVRQVKNAKSKVQSYVKHPASVIMDCYQGYESLSNVVTNSLDLTIDLVTSFQSILKEVEQKIDSDVS